MITIALDQDGNVLGALTQTQVDTMRYEQTYYYDNMTTLQRCWIEYGDENSTDPDVQTAYAAVQTQLDDVNINPDATFIMFLPARTPDTGLILLAKAIKAAQDATGQQIL